MYSPTQILKDGSKLLSKSNTSNKFNFTAYTRQKLESINPIITPTSSYNSKFKLSILQLINSYQIYSRLEIEKLKIVPYQSKFEKLKIPQNPTSLLGIPEYAFNLLNLPDFELSLESKDLKSSLFNSLIIEDKDLLELDNENNDLMKSIIIHLIIKGDLNFEKYIKSLEFDADVLYIICFQYFINPFKFDKFSRLNYTCKLLSTFRDLRIEENDWNFLKSLVDSNIYSFETNEPRKKSVLFENIISIVNQVNEKYFSFDLVGMLRILRNAETGFEIYNEDNSKHEVIKFNIKYYRYLIINRAIIEWNIKSLTKDTWEKYNFQKQWTIIWEIYYNNNNNNNNILPPGGSTFKRKVEDIINAI